MMLSVGDQAPNFTLTDQDKNVHTLSDLAGEKPVVLVFVPFAFTGVCESEYCELTENLNRFESAGVQLLGICCDRQPSIKAWTSQAKITFPVLSDGWPHGEVSKSYDCFDDALGCATRRTVVINKQGEVEKIFETNDLGTARELELYDKALANLK